MTTTTKKPLHDYVHKIDPEVKAEWVAELRLPGLRQGAGSLRRADSELTGEGLKSFDAYCCLGVLCRVMERRQVLPPAQQDGSYPAIYGYWHVRDDCPHDDKTSLDRAAHEPEPDGCLVWEEDLLPPAVVNALKLTQDGNPTWEGTDVAVMYQGSLSTLTELNDERQLSLPEIATIIEEQL
jgi:hypothetical protein